MLQENSRNRNSWGFLFWPLAVDAIERRISISVGVTAWENCMQARLNPRGVTPQLGFKLFYLHILYGSVWMGPSSIKVISPVFRSRIRPFLANSSSMDFSLLRASNLALAFSRAMVVRRGTRFFFGWCSVTHPRAMRASDRHDV